MRILKFKSVRLENVQRYFRNPESRPETVTTGRLPPKPDGTLKGSNHLLHRRQEEYDPVIILYPFLVRFFKHTDDSDIDRRPTVVQRISSSPNCVEILPVGSDCRLPPLFIITISTDAQVYLLSINEPQFAAELEERQAHLKLEFPAFEEPRWATPTVHVRILPA